MSLFTCTLESDYSCRSIVVHNKQPYFLSVKEFAVAKLWADNNCLYILLLKPLRETPSTVLMDVHAANVYRNRLAKDAGSRSATKKKFGVLPLSMELILSI